jgi:hypothetical protein
MRYHLKIVKYRIDKIKKKIKNKVILNNIGENNLKQQRQKE